MGIYIVAVAAKLVLFMWQENTIHKKTKSGLKAFETVSLLISKRTWNLKFSRHLKNWKTSENWMMTHNGEMVAWDHKLSLSWLLSVFHIWGPQLRKWLKTCFMHWWNTHNNSVLGNNQNCTSLFTRHTIQSLVIAFTAVLFTQLCLPLYSTLRSSTPPDLAR